MNQKPSAEDKAWLAEVVLKMYTKEFYEWGFVQTDPNLANFLVNGRQLCLLDFGATKSYTDEFRASYKKFLATLPSKDPAVIINAAIEFELLKEEESLETKMKFHNFMKHSVEPFFSQSEDGFFHFANNDYTDKTAALGKDFVLALKYTPPPSKLLFLHRKLGGVFALLKRLEVKMDLNTYWKSLIH
jgi:aarF domain-containing kinase